MNAMLVGADRLGNIPDLLASFGVRIMQHVSGRHAAHQRKLPGLPSGTELVILFTDFLGHNAMRHFRELAAREGIPVVCSRRSTSCLERCLENCLGPRPCPGGCPVCPARKGGVGS